MSAAVDHQIKSNTPEQSRRGFSVVQKAGLALIIMIFLVTAASGISLWFAASVQQSVKSMRTATEQSIRVSDLQLRWLAIAGILDTLSVTRSTPVVKEALNDQLAELERQLAAIASEPLGLSSEMIAKNQALTNQLRKTGLEMTTLVGELYELIEQGRWGTALQRRQSGMAVMQAQLGETLSQLNANIQNEVTAQVSEIARMQSLARSFALAAVAMALLFSVAAVWFTRRTILRPVQRLTADVRRISGARSATELGEIEPLPQQDELGELSQAMSRMAGWLRESYLKLEEQVEERTAQLHKRSVQLEVAAQVAKDIAATHELEVLLYQAVNTIRDRFDFYHAGIFLIDQQAEFAVLRAATGEAGREMLARGHRLKVGGTGLVGHAAQSGESRISADVRFELEHYKNPLLPETRSEAAFPLIVSGQVIGVLDVQSDRVEAFEQESVETMQIMADQLAIAIQNAKLIQQSQENIRELEAAYSRINKQDWVQFIRRSDVVGYSFDGLEIRPIMRENLSFDGCEPDTSANETVESTADFKVGAVHIPLQIRGELIGNLELWTQDEEFTEDDFIVLDTISSRLSQILDSARLYEDTQRRADRERLASAITAKLRASNDPHAILSTAVKELRKALQTEKEQVSL